MNITTFFTRERLAYTVSILCLIVAAIFSLGFHQSDEHYQILEFAGLKLGLTSAQDLAWEYHSQIRPAIQPAIAVAIYKLMGFFTTVNPFTVALMLRMCSALLTFLSMWLMYRTFRSQQREAALSRWFLLLSFFLWFTVYSGVRFSSENWSGQFFLIAFSLFFLLRSKSWLHYLGIGCLLGLSFVCRYQAGFLTAGFMLWLMLIRKEKFLPILYLIVGIILVTLIGILIDRWFYGVWTLTSWRYFQFNILYDKLSEFGVSPWWYYIIDFFYVGVPPFSLLFIFSILIFIVFKAKSPIVWCIAPFIAIHFVLGHKELRFLFPIIGFLPIVLVQSFEVVQGFVRKNIILTKPLKLFMHLFFLVNFILLLVVLFRPVTGWVAMHKKIYNDYPQPTTLYYIEKNPYVETKLNTRFYARSNLTCKKLDAVDSLHVIPKGALVFLSSKKRSPDFEKRNKLVYQSYPKWITKFNVNSWVERSHIQYVYEVI